MDTLKLLVPWLGTLRSSSLRSNMRMPSPNGGPTSGESPGDVVGAVR
jgi:hypothetical protein